MQRGFPDSNGGRAIEFLRFENNVSPDYLTNVAFLNLYPRLARPDAFLALVGEFFLLKVLHTVVVKINVLDSIHQPEALR